jgi:hypothetical protein
MTPEIESLAIIAGVVAVIVLVLYVWDRRTKDQPIDVMDAAKLAVSAGGVAGGVAYAVGAEDTIGAVTSAAATAQEMFVGKPEF